MMSGKIILRRLVAALLLLILAYLLLGLGFHLEWKSNLEACRATRIARGEFVEPEVFDNALGAFFDITSWPAYASANMRHFGDPFSTPCDR